jgi:hypothetical protein
MTQRLVDEAASILERYTSRKGFLIRVATVGSALTVAPLRYLLYPQNAYAVCSGCGCGANNCTGTGGCCDGYTTFCCTINGGSNTCPSGTVVAGWWLCNSSTFCSGNARYYVDCNAACNCQTGCSGTVHTDCGNNPNPICNTSCYSCTCQCAACSCSNRSTCKNRFRYGNCNTQINCTGAVICRVVSCAPPYNWTNCNTSSCTDNNTCQHTATCL